MKTFLFIITFAISLSQGYIKAESNLEWKKVDRRYADSNTNRWYHSIRCADSMNCVVLAYTIYKDPILRSTTDGGETWRDIYIDSTRDGEGPFAKTTSIWLKDHACPSKDLIIAVGDSGLIIRSTDQGKTWDKRSMGRYYHVSICMADDKYGIIRSFDGYKSGAAFFETTDGGVDWHLMNTPKDFSDSSWYFSMDLIEKGYFVAKLEKYGGNDSGMYKFINVYGNWDSVVAYTDPHENYGHNLSFISDRRGWTAGAGKPSKPQQTGFEYNQVIYYTNDGGKSWITQRDTFWHGGNPIYAIDFYDDRFGITTTVYGYAFLTHNGGRTWEEIHIDDNPWGAPFNVLSPQLTSFSSGYTIINQEYVYKFTRDWSIPHDTSGSPDDSVKSFFPSPPPGIVRFLGNYPNPFSDRTKIAYYLGEPRHVSLKIYDMRGKELETILEDFQSEGYHETDYVNKTLPPGIYYYRLRAGDRTFTRKMIVIK
ncbi:MAG: T9SS type A sorting domain-containing protein [Chloroflexota bacterium]